MFNVTLGVSPLGGVFEDTLEISDELLEACEDKSAREDLLNRFLEDWSEPMIDTTIEQA